MKKTVSIICMVLSMVLIFTACNNTIKTSSTESSSQTASVPNIELPKGGHVEAVKKMPEKPIRIAFLSFASNPFWFPIRDGANAANEYLKNFNCTVDYIVISDTLSAEQVVASMETSITKKYDAIAVVPIFDGTETVINKAVAAGIPVMTYCAEGTKKSNRLAFMGQDGKAAGELAGTYIEKYTDGKGKIGVITGNFGAAIHNARMNGAIDYLKQKAPGITVVGKYENNDSAETAYSLTKDMLTANPDIKLIYVTAGGPTGAAKAIQDLKLTGKVAVVAYDNIPENLVYVRSGEIVACLDQDPFGQGFDSSVLLYNYVVSGQKPVSEFIAVKVGVATPENVNEMYPK